MPPRGARTIARAALALSLAAAAPALAQLPLTDVTQDLAQDLPVALVADSVSFDETTGTLTATGSVEVYYGERTLSATRIVYDSRADRIRADGPIVLRDASGATLLADAADIDAKLRDGVIAGARALIADGVGTLAAVEGQRIDGRYTALSKAVYSSCLVCVEDPTPLWAIRARRIVHDEVERQVFYENATFEVLGQPVAWLPFFSHPDPGVKRRTGFLAPDFFRSSTFGFAVKIPYFYEIDPSRDLTVTAFPTSRDGAILGGEYRARLDGGYYRFDGSLGVLDVDDGRGDRLRGHVFGEARYDVSTLGLGSGTVAGFDLALSSDDSYVRRYGFSDEDRLTTEAFVERYGVRDFFSLAGVYFQSLRDDEAAGSIPLVLPEFALRRAVGEPVAGGELALEASGVALTRDEGRDVRRLSLGADWSRQTILDPGVVLRGFAATRLDIYSVDGDGPERDGAVTRLAPLAGVEARYPLIARGERVAHLVEPTVQFVAAPGGLNDSDIPNEDSLIVEFDETNLFDPNRFPGFDRVESGARLNLGVRYARIADDPFLLDATVGRVYRLSEETPFSSGSGLDERESDYVAALTLGWRPYATLSNRLRLDDSGEAARNEVRAQVVVGPARIETAYIFLREDDTAGALDDRSELAVGGRLNLDRNWSVSGFGRRDIEQDRYVTATGALRFRNECASVEVYVERDFTDSLNTPASTDVGLRVQFFGGDGVRSRSAVCGQPQ